MPTQKALTAFDSQSTTFLMEATSGAYHPDDDPNEQVKQQRIALLRLFIYCKDEFRRGPTVDAEIAAIQDPEKRKIHKDFCVLVSPIGQLNMDGVRARAEQLQQQYPNNVNDCMIVAESEFGEIDRLISYDRDLRRKLGPQTFIKILTPMECWERAKIPRGSKPVWVPAPDNPLEQQDWWRWQAYR